MVEGGVMLVEKMAVGLAILRAERHYQNQKDEFIEVEDEYE